MDHHIHKRHIPVLPDEVLQVLAPQAGEIYIDATAGFGGHAKLVLEATKGGPAILIDQDAEAIADLTESFHDYPSVRLLHSNFADVAWESLPRADMILLDLGVSSHHLNESQRGFSFQQEGPLDMRMDQSRPVTAQTLVNSMKEESLADTIWKYGEENRSRQIARAIVAARPLHTTSDLREVIHGVIGQGRRIDSATKTFQALRIAVNEELQALEAVLPHVADQLKPGGRLAVISFHSLEDRIVKNFFRHLTTPEVNLVTGQPITPVSFVQVTKKPLIASATEIDSNPRARSAKLRAVAKQT